jgi:hypothetical protein
MMELGSGRARELEEAIRKHRNTWLVFTDDAATYISGEIHDQIRRRDRELYAVPEEEQK